MEQSKPGEDKVESESQTSSDVASKDPISEAPTPAVVSKNVSFEKENPWSDRKKWAMDLLKGLLTFTLITVVTLLWLEARQEKRARERQQEYAKIELKSKLLSQFKTAFLDYQVDVKLYANELLAQASEGKGTSRKQPDERTVLLTAHSVLDELSGTNEVDEALQDLESKIDNINQLFLSMFLAARTGRLDVERARHTLEVGQGELGKSRTNFIKVVEKHISQN